MASSFLQLTKEGFLDTTLDLDLMEQWFPSGILMFKNKNIIIFNVDIFIVIHQW